MNVERLLRMADHLDQLPVTERFDIHSWDFCACGHATHIPEFSAAGLSVFGSMLRYRQQRAWPEPYCDYWGGSAAEVFFDIDQSIVVHLFDFRAYTSRHVTAKEVANRIRELLECIAVLEAEAREKSLLEIQAGRLKHGIADVPKRKEQLV